MNNISIKYLQEYIKSKDHHPELVKDYFLKLSEETGELSRAIRKNMRPTEPDQIKETIEEEIWDVIYYALAIANCYDIDVEKVIPVKENLNNVKYNTGKVFDPTISNILYDRPGHAISAGVGLRFFIPGLGPISVDYGLPLINPGDYGSTNGYFTFGTGGFNNYGY